MSGLRNWILDDNGEPKLATLGEWMNFCSDGRRIVAQEQVGQYWISTIFLGIDHNWGEGAPILWETMIFAHAANHRWDQKQDRCAGSREQAEAMHARMVDFVRSNHPIPSPPF
jgi:hypothetical protein